MRRKLAALAKQFVSDNKIPVLMLVGLYLLVVLLGRLLGGHGYYQGFSNGFLLALLIAVFALLFLLHTGEINQVAGAYGDVVNGAPSSRRGRQRAERLASALCLRAGRGSRRKGEDETVIGANHVASHGPGKAAGYRQPESRPPEAVEGGEPDEDLLPVPCRDTGAVVGYAHPDRALGRDVDGDVDGGPGVSQRVVTEVAKDLLAAGAVERQRRARPAVHDQTHGQVRREES